MEEVLACVGAQLLEAPEICLALFSEYWEAEPVALESPLVANASLTPPLHQQQSPQPWLSCSTKTGCNTDPLRHCQ